MAHLHSVYDSDAHFSINPITRALKNEASSKTSLIQYDHNSERFTFEIPRMIEGHDMSLCNVIRVHYINIDSKTKAQVSGVYEVEDMQISPAGDDVVICSWLISRNATQLVGSLNFLIRFSCVTDGFVDYAWNTATYTGISVSSGINADETFEDDYLDVIEQWKASVLAGFEVEVERIADEMKADVTAWEEAESANVRAEMTAFGGQWNEALDVERARIDSIVALPEGSTAGDAELADIRVSFDGNTYSNAGNAVRGQARQLSNNIASVKKYFDNTAPIVLKKHEGYCLNTSRELIEKQGYTTYYMAFRPQTLSIIYNVLPVVLDGGGNVSSQKIGFIFDSEYQFLCLENYVMYYYSTQKNYLKEMLTAAGKTYNAQDTYILAFSFADSDNVNLIEIAVDKCNSEGIRQDNILRGADHSKTKNLVDKNSFIGAFDFAGAGFKNGTSYFISNFFELDPTKPLYTNTKYADRQMAVSIRLYDENLEKLGSTAVIVPNENIYNKRINCVGINIPINYPTAKYGVVFWQESKYAHTQADFDAIMVSQELTEMFERAEPYIEAILPTESTIAELNKDKYLPLLAMANHNTLYETIEKRLQMLVTADVHMDYIRLKRAVDYANMIPTMDFVACLGDMAEGNGNTEDAAWFTSACADSALPIYPVIGNHDMGNSAAVGDSATVSAITEKWLDPIIGADANIDRPDGKSYYSRTFDNEKLVCIFLNSFDCPDANDGSAYAVNRTMPCWGQDQIDWLIGKLQSVPSGYGAVIFLHQWGDNFALADTAWNDPTGSFVQKTTFAGLIPDIVNAWQTGGALNNTYTAKDASGNTISIDGNPFTISVNTSFARQGVFVGYFTGHGHRNAIATSQTYPNQNIFAFPTTSANKSQNMNDLQREPFTKNQDAVVAVSVSMTDRKVYFAQIGANVTRFMVDRTYTTVGF